jgi:hypothetical protein
MFAALLGLKEGLADRIPHILIEGGKVLFGAANPRDRLDGLTNRSYTMLKLA